MNRKRPWPSSLRSPTESFKPMSTPPFASCHRRHRSSLDCKRRKPKVDPSERFFTSSIRAAESHSLTLVAAIESAAETENPASDFLLLHPDGTEIPIRLHGAILHDADGDPTGRVFVLKDLLARETADRSVVYLATHDHLTDLVNRTEFERQLARSLSSASEGNQQHTLLYLDLDDFKQFNDTFGHPAGDKMLKQFASFLKTRFRETDTLGRLGGDKFAVLLEECPAVRARGITEKLFKDLGNFRLAWNKTSVPASVSVGVVALDSESPEASRDTQLSRDRLLYGEASRRQSLQRVRAGRSGSR